MTKVIHVHLIFEKKNYYFGSISAIFNTLTEEEIWITKSSLLHAETPPQNGLKLDYIFKLLHFNYLPPLIRCDCMIIARLVTLQLPSVIPACKRLLFVV